MALAPKRIIGLEINAGGVGGVVVRHDQQQPGIERICLEPLPNGVLKPSRSGPNLIDPQAVLVQLKLVRQKLPAGELGAAVSLPDSSGRMVLLELDESWQDRQEAEKIILWKLKNRLPHAVPAQHIDFQVLEHQEGKPALVLVTMMAASVLGQYDLLLHQAGFSSIWVGLHQMSILQACAAASGNQGTTLTVSWYAGTLGIVFCRDGIPFFWRTKQLPSPGGDAAALDLELHGSLIACHRLWPGSTVEQVFCFCLADARQKLGELLHSLAGQVPVRYLTLEERFSRTATPLLIPQGTAAAVAAALARL